MKTSKFMRWLLAVASTLILAPLMSVPSWAQDSQTPPDNTKRNKDQSATADQQKMSPADRETTQKIRKAIMDDKSLSTYAHNIKVITRNGKVTLRGPVRSEDEKHAIEAKAADVAGAENVTNDLEIAPPKS
jgi:hyperosmotically inducible periplasmic protein